MSDSFAKFLKRHKVRIIIVAVIVVILLAFFLIGALGSGRDINYIPV